MYKKLSFGEKHTPKIVESLLPVVSQIGYPVESIGTFTDFILLSKPVHLSKSAIPN